MSDEGGPGNVKNDVYVNRDTPSLVLRNKYHFHRLSNNQIGGSTYFDIP